jgi:ribosome maturation factor RimP
MEITDKVRDVLKDYAEERGIEIIDVIYRREGQGMVLRVVADNAEGIRISECAALNNFLSEALDKEDVIQDRYVLEVSSPGLDRPIKTDRDFERAISKKLELTTYEMIEGRKTHEGRLIGMDKETIVIESHGTSTVIPRDRIALARLKIEI